MRKQNSLINNCGSPSYMANIICTRNNKRAKLATDKASSWNIWFQESDFSYEVAKSYSQQERGFRSWCVTKKTLLFFMS